MCSGCVPDLAENRAFWRDDASVNLYHAIRFGSYGASKEAHGRAFDQREVPSAAEADPHPASVLAAVLLEEKAPLFVPWGCRATGRRAVAGPAEELRRCAGPTAGSLPQTGRR
jgi:hypothetical protein